MITTEEINLLASTHNGRMNFIELLHGKKIVKENWQEKKTPLEVVERMCDKTALEGKSILVLFNLEFIEHLVKKCKIPVDKITFFADSRLEKITCEKLYKVESSVINKEFIENKEFQKMSKKFDLAFSNPPYTRGVDLKIIKEVDKICDEMVIVHPSTWLIDQKGKKKAYNDFKDQFEGRTKSIELFNGNPVFGIGLFVPCSITHINGDNGGKIKVKNFDEELEIENIRDVTKFGKSWFTIVKPFMQKIKDYISDNGCVWDKNLFEIDDDKFHVQLAAIRGTPYRGSDCTAEMLLNDFYTMVMKDSEGNKGIREPRLHKPGGATPTFGFSTEKERDNYINYLKTDFARFCLSIYKNGQHLETGELNIVPWLDFTEEWDDEKLFKKFNVNQETQDYIREFLPDFHNIRN